MSLSFTCPHRGFHPLNPNPDPNQVMGCFINHSFCNCLGISVVLSIRREFCNWILTLLYRCHSEWGESSDIWMATRNLCSSFDFPMTSKTLLSSPHTTRFPLRSMSRGWIRIIVSSKVILRTNPSPMSSSQEDVPEIIPLTSVLERESILPNFFHRKTKNFSVFCY